MLGGCSFPSPFSVEALVSPPLSKDPGGPSSSPKHEGGVYYNGEEGCWLLTERMGKEEEEEREISIRVKEKPT